MHYARDGLGGDSSNGLLAPIACHVGFESRLPCYLSPRDGRELHPDSLLNWMGEAAPPNCAANFSIVGG